QVHVRIEIGIERSHVAPVAKVARLGARDLVLQEVVHVRGALVHHHRDDVAAHVVPAAVVGRILFQRIDQHVAVEHVVAHRGECLVGMGGSAGFSRNASMLWPSGAVCTTPKSVASILGTGIAATVTPAPRARCWSIICIGSIRYTWSAPKTTTMSGRSS